MNTCVYIEVSLIDWSVKHTVCVCVCLGGLDGPRERGELYNIQQTSI